MANILASYDWIKEHLKTDASVAEFAKKMTDAGNSVEHIHDVAEAYNGIVVGRILVVDAHPNADKLRVVTVDVGKKVQIVCGGLNLEVDQLVCVALPGAKVRWHGEGELIELKEAELRGVQSFGMICAPDEVGFEKLQAGEKMIWDLTNVTDAKPGTPLVKALGLEDTLFDIEVTTNRPDAMSIVGQAREASACGLGKFEMRKSKFETSGKSEGKNGKMDLKVSVKDKDLCPRYQAVVIEGVKVAPSPWWMQKRLLLSGHRPINNVVDVTNYVLHELGQPLHAFDADTLEGQEIIVRKAKKGEKILALDGKEYELDASMLVIADAKKPVAVAGVMGGELTGTKEGTTRLVIESAVFDAVSVRRTARTLNLYSDSSSLFEKGLSPEATTGAIERAIELICELTGGHVASVIYDARAEKYKPEVYPYDAKRISDVIGLDVPEKKQKEILEALGFVIDGKKATVPYWRDHDIEDAIDLAEEVARVVGYANVPSVIPTGEIPVTLPDPKIVWERKLKNILKGAGVSEVYSNAFVSEAILGKYKIPLDAASKLENPLTDEWVYMRPTLVPSMLTVIEENQRRFEAAALFELNHVHHPRKGDIPSEDWRLLIAGYGPDGGAQAFRYVKGILERVLREAGVAAVSFESGGADDHFHPGRSAKVIAGKDMVGTIGELAPHYAQAFGIDRRVVLADLNLDHLLPHLGAGKRYQPTPEFQDLIRDLSFVLPERKTHAEVQAALVGVDPLISSVSLVDVYQGKGIEAGQKSMTYRLSLRASDRTLSSDEADAVMNSVGKMLTSDFGAILR